MNLLRPIQNTTTDASISTPGMPNATRTPAYFQISGIERYAKKLPKLMMK